MLFRVAEAIPSGFGPVSVVRTCGEEREIAANNLLAGKKSLDIQFVVAAHQGPDTHPLDWFS